MTDFLKMLLLRISNWPEQAPTELTKPIDEIEAKHIGVYKLSAEERAAIERGLEEMRQGKFASDEGVAAVFNRYR